MDDVSLSIHNHSIRVIETKNDDDKTLTSQITSSICGSYQDRQDRLSPKKLSNFDRVSLDHEPNLDDISLDSEEHGVEAKSRVRTAWIFDEESDSASDPVFSIVESSSDFDTKVDDDDTFGHAWRKQDINISVRKEARRKTDNVDEDSFDALFAKWASGEMGDNDFNKLIMTVRDGEETYRESFRMPKDVATNVHYDDPLVQTEDLDPKDNSFDSLGYDDICHGRMIEAVDSPSLISALGASSFKSLKTDDEQSMLSVALQPMQQHGDVESNLVFGSTTKCRWFDEDKVDRKGHNSDQYHSFQKDYEYNDLELGHDGVFQESFNISEVGDYDNVNARNASKIIQDIKKMYATILDEDDRYTENTHRTEDFVDNGHVIKEIFVKRIEMDAEARNASEKNYGSIHPHSSDRQKGCRQYKRLAALSVLFFLTAFGIMIWCLFFQA